MVNFSKAFTLLQAARTAARELESAPLAQLLLDLQGQLLQVQVLVMEQQIEDQTMQSTLRKLRWSLSVQRKLERHHDAYLLVKGKDDVRGPYCVSCWDVRDMLQDLVEAGDGMGYCSICRETVQSVRMESSVSKSLGGA